LLKTRIITAAILIALLLLVIFRLPPVATTVVVTALVLAGAWEWAGFMRMAGRLPRLAYVTGIALCLPLAWQFAATPGGLETLVAAATAWWLVALAWIVLAPRRAADWSAALAGVMALVPAWVALVYLRRDPPFGAQWLLFALLLVWAADIGAYFAGRGFGRHKLAPAVSPGKTWEGVAGALAASGVTALAGSHWFGVPPLPFVPLCLAAVALSVVGDLTESLLKRFAGLKDSGTLFPGHGGVMDRIDSITSAVPSLLFGLLSFGVVR